MLARHPEGDYLIMNLSHVVGDGMSAYRPAFQFRNISTNSVKFHHLLATSGPFRGPDGAPEWN